MELSGARALVTGVGSAQGIGMAIAKQLMTSGANVAITSRSSRVHERGKELKCISFDADLTHESEVKELVEAAANGLGGIDIVINNAGMTSVDSPATSESRSAADLSFDQWRSSLARNLDSAFLVTHYCLPHLRRSKNGRIIFIASTTGPLQAMRSEAGYASAKAALVGLARSLAVDEAPITANVIAPGWIATESQTTVEAEEGARIPLGRSGTPDEVASAALWLASPLAAFITGQVIVIDGGNSIAEQRT